MKGIVPTLICLSISPLLYAASPCEMVVNEISHAQQPSLVKAKATPKTKNILWNNLTWLQKKLGHADPTAVVETLYQWKDAMLLVRDGKFFKSKNLSREFGDYPSVEDINLTLNEEPQKVTSDTLHQYRWICPGSSSYIAALVDKNHHIIKLEGQKCPYTARHSLTSCVSFARRAVYTELESKLSPVILLPSSPPPNPGIKPEMLSAYNHFFNIKAQNQAQVEADMSQRLRFYFSNLRWCRQGTYAYPLPYFMGNVLLGKAVIRGQQNNFCLVETSQQIPGTNNEHHHFDMKCWYNAADLRLFTDEEAINIAIGKSSNNLALQKAREKNCKLIYSEKELAIVKTTQLRSPAPLLHSGQ